MPLGLWVLPIDSGASEKVDPGGTVSSCVALAQVVEQDLGPGQAGERLANRGVAGHVAQQVEVEPAPDEAGSRP